MSAVKQQTPLRIKHTSLRALAQVLQIWGVIMMKCSSNGRKIFHWTETAAHLKLAPEIQRTRGEENL